MVVPRLSPKLNVLISQSDQISIIVTNTTSRDISFRVVGVLSIDNQTIANLLFQNSPVENIDPMQVKTYKLNELHIVRDALVPSSNIVRQIQRTGYLPAGYLNWCFQLVAANDRAHTLSQNICKGNIIQAFQEPIAISPENNSSTDADRPIIFKWTPVSPSFPADLGKLNYKVSVFEVLEGQDKMQAFRTNQPVWSKETNANQLIWPFEVPKNPGQYVWVVKAFDRDGFEVGVSDKISDVKSFTITESIKFEKSEKEITSKSGFVKMIFTKKETGEIVYKMFVPNSSTVAVQKLFDYSVERESYDLKLEIVRNIPLDSDSIALAQIDENQRFVSVYTNQGKVLTFRENVIIAHGEEFKKIWTDFDPLVEDFIQNLKRVSTPKDHKILK